MISGKENNGQTDIVVLKRVTIGGSVLSAADFARVDEDAPVFNQWNDASEKRLGVDDISNDDDLVIEQPSSLSEPMKIIRSLHLLSTNQYPELHPYLSQLQSSIYIYHIQNRRAYSKIMVKTITSLEELKSELKHENNKGKLIVIDFFATWCGPCLRIAPLIEEWSKDVFADTVVFLKCDVDEAEAVSQEYNVEAMPTFVFIKDGAEIHRCVGANGEKLKAEIESKK
ncbi:unnamed protein product [Rotaria socialis]|uniref:Thioredoxin domain-containing protein n=1 Tax=Rotaria socialis TaxID=392032 RepID=A0A820V218_9BILA|nr:unnamed protein product [Rotaria socialis]CAF4494178.1 unnamed protein product [Rotaria socialis]